MKTLRANVPSLQAIVEMPWALLPASLSRLVEYVSREPVGGSSATQVLALSGPQLGGQRVGPVSVIPVYGLIDHRASFLGSLFGGTSIEELRAAFRADLADPNVKAIILEVDSPGGSVAGVTEFAAEIRAARGGAKPIVAAVNTLAASAAYWLASQADECVMTPSASVGGIGIYAVHQEISRLLDQEGVTTTIISAGPYKTEANEWQPLTDEARAELQQRADAFYGQFIGDVARGRRVSADQVRGAYGEGRVLMADQAKQVGMVDRIETLDATVGRLYRAAGGAAPRRLRAAIDPLMMEAGAVGEHSTATATGAWDGPANETRLPSPMPLATARAAYAWFDDAAVTDGEITKAGCRFIHHEVSADGQPGSANMMACSSGIGILNGGRGGTTIPGADRQGVYDHLANHLSDAEMEPPPYTGLAPFGERLAALATEAEELAAHAQERSRLRAKENRPAFSTTTETALRTTRDAISALLATGDPEPSGATGPAVHPPVPVAPVVQPAQPTVRPRVVSREAFARQLQEHTR